MMILSISFHCWIIHLTIWPLVSLKIRLCSYPNVFPSIWILLIFVFDKHIHNVRRQCHIPEYMHSIILGKEVNSLNSTHWSRVTHESVNKLGQHWFRWWTNAVLLLIGPLETNSVWKSKVFIQGNAFENVVTKSAAISSRPQIWFQFVTQVNKNVL